MQGVQVLLVMEGLKTELRMQIQVKQGRLSATTAMENGVALDKEQLLFIAGGQDTVVDEDVDEQPVQDLALSVDNIFQADDFDAFDFDVDEAPTTQTMFMANLSSADPVYDEASPSYDSDLLSDVAKDNVESIVQSNVSYVPNDAYMMIINEMHEQTAQCVSVNNQNNVVNALLTTELAKYKEQVELYERRAKFELNKREQKIEEQLRIIITNYNIKEEMLKKELHSVKMQLNSTINHNKSMPNYDRALVHDSEDTLKIAETTRKQMLEKMNDPECVKKKIKIAPHNYSKENYLAIFTPQKQLTPEQIFWSNDLIKIQAKALNAQAKSANPNRAMTGYHPNTPTKLVPKVIPTKIQVQ
ncbi:hypothetical protein Tco_1513018, partial [Tanacetum coccineum]